MSHHDKLSFWQKIKRLLTTSAPHSVVNRADARHGSLQADVSADNVNTGINNKDQSTNTGDTDLPNSNDTQNSNLDSKEAKNINFNNNDDTPIVDYLKQYMDDKQWHYTHYPPKATDSQQSHHFSLRMRNKQLDCGYLFRIQEGNSLLAVYGILPFLIPESHQSAAMLLITQINYDMLIGNLEMDVNDGEIRYKNAIDVEVVGIDDNILEHLLQSVIAMTTVTYEIFSDLINTQYPAEDMPTLLGELRQQADARTFFLATQKMQ